MPEIIYHKETKNWVRGNYALRITKRALCRYINDKFDEFIESLSFNDLEVTQFLHCLGSNDIKDFAQLKEYRQTIQCIHSACINIMEIFVRIHQQASSLRKCYEWELSPCHYVQNQNLPQHRNEMIWQITKLYMYVDKRVKYDQECLENLDISKAIKVIRNCSELCPDGSLDQLKKALEARNQLAHSPKLSVDDKSIKQMLEEFQKLLSFLQSSSKQYIDEAKQDIQRLSENEFYIGDVPPELKPIFKRVREAKEVATFLSSSIGTHSHLQTDIKQLLNLLEDICKHEETPLCLEPKYYKKTIEGFTENQMKAIDNDLLECDKDSEEYKKLIEIRKDIETIHEKLKSETDKESDVEYQKFLNIPKMQTERLGSQNVDIDRTETDDNHIFQSSQNTKSNVFERYNELDVFKCPQRLLVTNDEGHLEIVQKTAEQLMEITSPVNVVSVVGLYGTGKSFLLNRLGGASVFFSYL